MDNIEYIKLFMEYEADDMPVVYFYEVDVEHERLALRAIEVFKDRQVHLIDDIYRNVIEVVSIPTVDEINDKVYGNEFYALKILKDEFEEIWENGFYNGDLSA